MAVMSMKQVINAVNDSTVIKIYEGKRLIARGNWYQDDILDYIRVARVEADLDATANVCTVRVPEVEPPAGKDDLKKKIRRYMLMEKHREMVHSGKFGAARILLKMLREGKVTLRLDDDSYIVEIECEKAGCHIWYDRRGYKAVAHL